MEQERFGRLEESSGEASSEVRILVKADGGKVLAVLRQKKEGGGWEIRDGRRQELVSALSIEAQDHLMHVIRSVQDLFSRK